MTSRKSHRKSRNGCRECKARRIKCDERLPRCGGCIKRETQCLFASDPSSNTLLHVAPSPSPSVAPAPSRSSSSHPPPYPRDDLELLHHFTIRTSKTCDRSVKPLIWWQEDLPCLAIAHPFLLHTILSFTGLHMAFGRPEQRTKYLGLALDYRDRALKKLPDVFQNPLDGQSEACFWATAMIGLITLARSQVDRSATAISVMLELSRLWRGSKLVDDMYAAASGSDKSVGPRPGSSIGSHTAGSSTEPELAEGLRNFINYISEFDSSDKLVYVEALELLQKEHHMWTQNNSTGILSWAACVDKRFMQLVEQKDIIASLTVAFYGAALHELRNTWYIGSFGSELVREILPLRDAPDSTLITIQDFVITRVENE